MRCEFKVIVASQYKTWLQAYWELGCSGMQSYYHRVCFFDASQLLYMVPRLRDDRVIKRSYDTEMSRPEFSAVKPSNVVHTAALNISAAAVRKMHTYMLWKERFFRHSQFLRALPCI